MPAGLGAVAAHGGGVVLTIWDVLAERASFPAAGGDIGRTGLAGRPVPVEQNDPAGSSLLLLQLIEPFQVALMCDWSQLASRAWNVRR